jgi:small multidrug resistance pump
MGWLYLAAAIVFEVCGTSALKLSDGLSQLWPSIASLGFYLLSLACLSIALRRIELGIAYAIWCGVGIAVISAIGIVWFREPVTALKVASLILVVAGVAGLNWSSSH